jgi:hypothetical protein
MLIFEAILLGIAALGTETGQIGIGQANGSLTAARLRPGGTLMLEPRMRLFVVQCRHNGGQATTFYVPGLNADEAIIRARTTARDSREHNKEITDPFERLEGLEVRVGAFDPGDQTKIVFGDWSLVAH